jgi:branched-chain amino acid aminotransferase
MEVKVIEAAPEQRKPKPPSESQLGFGKIFTDHVFTMTWNSGEGWHDPVVEPYHPLQIDPTAMCLHYGQEIFEGMKAYRGKDGHGVYLFRPTENIKRMNVSAERLCMPQIEEKLFMEALEKLLSVDQDWIPRSEGSSLYIRPTMIATERALGVHPSNEYLFFIIMSPVGAYYAEGFSPTRIYVTEEYIRSAPGGIGYCKAAGNYAASLYANEIAKKIGYTQVLWLDAMERKYVEEVGTSNIFFLINDELITPPLSGTILPGITRNSIIQLAKKWGMHVSERKLSMDEITASIANGAMQEAFAAGTAAVVSPVGWIFYRDHEYALAEGKIGKLTRRLYDEILNIQYGIQEDSFGWRVKILN